mmetsp:Transcript_59131/g.116026  ORF Transcript_59131/g.116026 Transcript_59131/m.116026 type:complete len:107 (-) Transcript_59131:238-558(-)
MCGLLMLRRVTDMRIDFLFVGEDGLLLLSPLRRPLISDTEEGDPAAEEELNDTPLLSSPTGIACALPPSLLSAGAAEGSSSSPEGIGAADWALFAAVWAGVAEASW